MVGCRSKRNHAIDIRYCLNLFAESFAKNVKALNWIFINLVVRSTIRINEIFSSNKKPKMKDIR